MNIFVMFVFEALKCVSEFPLALGISKFVVSKVLCEYYLSSSKDLID